MIYEVERADLDNFIEGTMRKVTGLAKDTAALAELVDLILSWILEQQEENDEPTENLRRNERKLACIMARLRGAAANDA